ncbi:MAG TPA: 50S ribosomal protein L11 [Candidatus Wildermuthbacteria bacterium]|uniref:Large ribosomal subunit protein uL11 n=1 Tax=Candidatus Yanofskybacteria bacterium GW2011_GWC1_48_11 TaxID=1619027 RepID=A0A837IP66_9BACT|nr:MAG: 50S ribosomal protein L11 [Candidatus Yanofskybacteria bacterium GW2011_GWC1_48_11]KKW04620.1 MAG: 50S ribosomal protein L11 [Parcubacteria group bacterium GW2011_GWB1_49_12]KKW09122.1 MAG: 50S ribosomal protein L11 [Parcubacteria group bacterium GW2011_GWA1_49_26]KKW13607.1 MAG: 50S ribosomal protein L11 [Parcubacteria group bacterium GW2011_GWA2_50_10]OHA61379.1 MAG: 50S ribosomal protein L11 [Candidatus Wildermuthbacteria bacterium GWA1_49_26]OHA66278.1 MAG: 50S ribosomal protein L1
MAKKIKAIVKLHIQAGQATPAPPVGPALAQHGVNIGEFTKQFNEATRDQQGFKLPTDIIVYVDRTFTFKLHQPQASALIKKAIGLEKGSGTPNKQTVATITKAQLKEVAEKKMADLNTKDLDKATKIIAGTAKSMGVKVE